MAEAEPGEWSNVLSGWPAAVILVVLLVLGIVRAARRRARRRSPRPTGTAGPSTAGPAPARTPSVGPPSEAAPPRHGTVLAIDVGTYNTVAVLRRPGRAATVLLFDGTPLLASNVYADEAGALCTGRDAAHLARLDPSRCEPNPKQRIDEVTVLLGDREFEVVDLIAAVLRRVVEEARRSAGTVDDVVLTHPAAWGPRRQATLRTAAHRAGIPAPRLLAEPVAAARQYLEQDGSRWYDGQPLLVFDFGAGTLDVAAVRRRGNGFEVISYDGMDGLGGLDIDAAIVDRIGAEVARGDPDAWRRIATPDTVDDRRARRLLWEDARAAKEMLSRTSVAPLPVTGYQPGAHLTRDELDRLAAPLVERAVQVLARVLDTTGIRADRAAGVFLVGGSSRLPLVAHTILTRLHVAATVHEQPETVVATGAAAVTVG